MPFTIHEQLQADCHMLGRLDFCYVLLNRNAVLPWFILVPETAECDLLALPAPQRKLAMAEAGCIAAFIKSDLAHPKINFAAIGNVVPQLHLHVVGRKPGDACWPAPVWGNLPTHEDYLPDRIIHIAEQLRRQYGLHAVGELLGRVDD